MRSEGLCEPVRGVLLVTLLAIVSGSLTGCENIRGKARVHASPEHVIDAGLAPSAMPGLEMEEVCTWSNLSGTTVGVAQLRVPRHNGDAGSHADELWHIFCSGKRTDVLQCRVTQINLEHLPNGRLLATDVFADSYDADRTEPYGYRLSFAKIDFERGLRLIDGTFVACPTGPSEARRVTTVQRGFQVAPAR